MAKKINWFPLIVGLLVIGFLAFSNLNQSLMKQSVAFEGRSCSDDSDCPCWGYDNQTDTSSFGIGVGTCEDNVCDMDLCVDIEPSVDYVKTNLFSWFGGKTNLGEQQIPNLLIAAGILILSILAMTLPKG